jgi:hypothetical protein
MRGFKRWRNIWHNEALMISPLQSLRAVGVFLGNLVNAIVGIAMVNSVIYNIFPWVISWGRRLLLDDFLSAFFSFVLGYIVYYKWKPASAKYVWLVGACAFGLRLTHLLVGAHGTLFAEMYGNVHDLPNFKDWYGFTVPLVRTGFYSAGAFCCSRIQHASSLRTLARG